MKVNILWELNTQKNMPKYILRHIYKTTKANEKRFCRIAQVKSTDINWERMWYWQWLAITQAVPLNAISYSYRWIREIPERVASVLNSFRLKCGDVAWVVTGFGLSRRVVFLVWFIAFLKNRVLARNLCLYFCILLVQLQYSFAWWVELKFYYSRFSILSFCQQESCVNWWKMTIIMLLSLKKWLLLSWYSHTYLRLLIS